MKESPSNREKNKDGNYSNYHDTIISQGKDTSIVKNNNSKTNIPTTPCEHVYDYTCTENDTIDQYNNKELTNITLPNSQNEIRSKRIVHVTPSYASRDKLYWNKQKLPIEFDETNTNLQEYSTRNTRNNVSMNNDTNNDIYKIQQNQFTSLQHLTRSSIHTNPIDDINNNTLKLSTIYSRMNISPSEKSNKSSPIKGSGMSTYVPISPSSNSEITRFSINTPPRIIKPSTSKSSLKRLSGNISLDIPYYNHNSPSVIETPPYPNLKRNTITQQVENTNYHTSLRPRINKKNILDDNKPSINNNTIRKSSSNTTSIYERHQQLQQYIDNCLRRKDVTTTAGDSNSIINIDDEVKTDIEDDTVESTTITATTTNKNNNTNMTKISYIGELSEEGVMHGHGVLVYSSGIKYEGDFYYGKRHGYGKLIYPLASIIVPDSSINTANTQTETSCIIVEGNFENDQLIGDAHIFYPDGEEYIGTVVDGKSHGKGIYHYNNKDIYDGEWCNGLRNGYGTMIFFVQDGNIQEIYQGEWKDDTMDGNGIYKHADGSIYEGLWSNGKMHGYGILYYANGNIYRGDFYRDLKHGKGELVYSEGGKYIGDWVDDVAHGYGCVEYEGGEMYIGEFSYGFKCGNGKLTLPDGDMLYGIWKDDKLIGNAKMVYHETGNIYLGEFDGAIRSGHGQLLEISTNTIYEGQWINNTRHGEGKIIFPDKSYAIGQWSNGKPLDLKYILPDNSPWLDPLT